MQSEAIGLALLEVGGLLIGVAHMRALIVAEPSLVEPALGEPTDRRAVFLVDHDRFGAEPAPVGQADEEREQEASETAGEADPADHFGDDRGDLRRIHAAHGIRRSPAPWSSNAGRGERVATSLGDDP